MSSCLSTKQVQKKLACAAQYFADAAVHALETWMEDANDLRGYPQYPSTEATRQLVGAALADNRREQLENANVIRAWVAKHLSGISKPMLECVSSQLDMTAKRISILHSLLKSGWQPDSAQFIARLEAERTAYINVERQWWVLCVILPVAVLCGGVAWLNDTRQSMSWCVIPDGDKYFYSLVRSTLSLNYAAPQFVAENLKQAKDICMQLQNQVAQLRANLTEIGLGVFDARYRDTTNLDWVWHVACNTDMAWLWFAIQLLPNCEWAVLFLRMMHAPTHGVKMHVSEEHLSPGLLHEVCRLVAHPGVLPEITRHDMLESVANLLVSLGIQQMHLQATGVPQAAQQQLVPRMQDAVVRLERSVQVEPDFSTGSQSLQCQRAAGSSGINDQGLENRSNDAAGDGQVGAGVVPCSDDNTNDMNTLLQMMYGCSM